MDKKYSFSVELAVKYGVPGAIMLENLLFWIDKNKANEKHFYDGRYWTYNSIRAFGILFPFWTEKQIRGVLSGLIEKKIVITGNFNKLGYDRTLWYSINEDTLKGESILPVGQMDSTELANRIDQKGEPIPDINTDVKPDEEKEDFSLPLFKKLCFTFTKEYNKRNGQIAAPTGGNFTKAADIFNCPDPEKLYSQAVQVISFFFDSPMWFNTEKTDRKKVKKSLCTLGVFLTHLQAIITEYNDQPEKAIVEENTATAYSEKFDKLREENESESFDDNFFKETRKAINVEGIILKSI